MILVIYKLFAVIVIRLKLPYLKIIIHPDAKVINMNNLTYIWSQGMVDKIAKKVAEEPMENMDEGNYEYMPKMKSQHIDHVETERLVDLERERTRERMQMDMFNDPDWNWSGQR